MAAIATVIRGEIRLISAHFPKGQPVKYISRSGQLHNAVIAAPGMTGYWLERPKQKETFYRTFEKVFKR